MMRINHPVKEREDAFLKVHHRNQPKFRIAQTKIRNAIADLFRFCLVLSRQDRDDGGVAIGGGKLLADPHR